MLKGSPSLDCGSSYDENCLHNANSRAPEALA